MSTGNPKSLLNRCHTISMVEIYIILNTTVKLTYKLFSGVFFFWIWANNFEFQTAGGYSVVGSLLQVV